MHTGASEPFSLCHLVARTALIVLSVSSVDILECISVLLNLAGLVTNPTEGLPSREVIWLSGLQVIQTME